MLLQNRSEARSLSFVSLLHEIEAGNFQPLLAKKQIRPLYRNPYQVLCLVFLFARRFYGVSPQGSF